MKKKPTVQYTIILLSRHRTEIEEAHPQQGSCTASKAIGFPGFNMLEHSIPIDPEVIPIHNLLPPRTPLTNELPNSPELFKRPAEIHHLISASMSGNSS